MKLSASFIIIIIIYGLDMAFGQNEVIVITRLGVGEGDYHPGGVVTTDELIDRIYDLVHGTGNEEGTEQG